MKKFLNNLINIVFIGAISVLLVFVWQKFWIFQNLELFEQIIVTIPSGLLTLLIMLFNSKDSENDKHMKRIRNNPIGLTFTLLHNFDPEKHIKELRRLRTRVNQKISRSETNKIMIQASKDICGKNCKCKEIRKIQMCEDCKMYEAYVQYLKDTLR